jgi:ketosteroid isomerase-like protein
MDIKEFAKKFIRSEDEAWQNGHFDAMEALEDPDVIYHVIPLPDMVGWEAHKQYIQANRQIIPGIRQDWQYLAGEGNLFALSYKSSGTTAAEIPAMNIPKGKKIATDYLFVLQVKDGRVAGVWSNGTFTLSD